MTSLSGRKWKEFRLRIGALLVIAVFMGLRYGSFVAYHSMMTTNDKGRDFYVSDLILKGGLPYRDFDWPYGPAAPFYYAAWYKALGTSLLSYSAGELAASMAAAIVMFYLGVELVGMPLGLAAPLVWTFIMGARAHSGNYILCVLCAQISLIAAVRILKGRGNPNACAAVIAVFCGMLTLLKLNAGIALAGSIGAVLTAWRLIEVGRKPEAERASCRPPGVKTALIACGAVGIIVCAVYIYLTTGLREAWIERCFPFMSKSHHEYGNVFKFIRINLEEMALALTFTDIFWSYIRACSLNFFIWMSLAAAVMGRRIMKKRFGGADDWTLLLLAAALLGSSHEFLISGSWYSLYYVPGIVLTALPLVLAKRCFASFDGLPPSGAKDGGRKPLRFSYICEACLAVFLALSTSWLLVELLREKNMPGFYYLPMPRGKVWHQAYYEESEPWSVTISKITDYITRHAPPDEPILVVPFDPLHLFLSDRRQVCRTVDFSRYQNVTEEEEREIARQMEEQRVRLVVWTNTTVIMNEKPAERFGHSHCAWLGRYILSNYEEKVRLGNNESAGMSFAMHGATIYERKTPFNPQPRP
ncbi:MAG TPA: hypothetical protein PL033_09415 [Candidatus Brocadiia bacterium]|nr:hypothetical protein [Candidatus Brocadiia bacterium]